MWYNKIKLCSMIINIYWLFKIFYINPVSTVCNLGIYKSLPDGFTTYKNKLLRLYNLWVSIFVFFIMIYSK
jgi:hypothetical protein